MGITTRQPWQTLLPTRTTVPASKVLEASDVLRGFEGSWAGSWSLDPTYSADPTYTAASALLSANAQLPGYAPRKYSHLGVPGSPEINFQPYAHNTNRMGLRGGALVGNPISFSMVGPTAKNPQTTWDWLVNNSGSQDVLTLRGAGSDTIFQLYGITSGGNGLLDFPGGLYLTVSQTAEPGGLGFLSMVIAISGTVNTGDTVSLGTIATLTAGTTTTISTFKTTASAGSANAVATSLASAINFSSATPPYLTAVAVGSNVTVTSGVLGWPGYVPVTFTFTGATGITIGSSGLYGWTSGGVGDGTPTTSNGAVYPLTASLPSSKYEIFRVTNISTTAITLDASKRLSNHFTFFNTGTNNNCVRSINLFQPAAARLVAVPQPGGTVQHETAFAVVPPPRALNQDEQYPYAGATPTATWSSSTWYENSIPDFSLLAGNIWEYKNKPSLPIPRPLGSFTATLPVAPPVSQAAGQMVLTNVTIGNSGVPTDLVGTIIHVTEMQAGNPNQDLVTSLGQANDLVGFKASYESPLGWFEVIAGNNGGGVNNTITVRRMEEADVVSGRSFIGASAWFTQHGSSPSPVTLSGTYHKPISSLWVTTSTASPPVLSYAAFDMDAVDSARLKNIIDPSLVLRSLKDQPNPPGPVGATPLLDNPSRADRAIFNTSTTNGGVSGSNANPGSLMELGFRMVLFRAKTAVVTVDSAGHTATRCIPDWDHPITSNEVVLDPAQPNVAQNITVDYSNGMVYLSLPPQPGSPLYPSGGTSDPVFTAPDNPRGELVLFAACVPYSQETGQLGASVRVTADTSVSSKNQADLWSTTNSFPLFYLQPQSTTAQQIIVSQNVGGTNNGLGNYHWINVSGDLRTSVPDTGFVDLLYSNTGYPIFSSSGSWSGSLFGYSGLLYNQAFNFTSLGLMGNVVSIQVTTIGSVAPGDTITVGGHVLTATASGSPTSTQFTIGVDEPTTASNIFTKLCGSTYNTTVLSYYQTGSSFVSVQALSGTATVAVSSSGITADLASTTIVNTGAWGGGVFNTSATLTSSAPVNAYFRHDVWGPNTPNGIATVTLDQDKTYGIAKRNGTIRFAGAKVQANADGSVTVTVGASNPAVANNFGKGNITGTIGPSNTTPTAVMSTFINASGNVPVVVMVTQDAGHAGTPAGIYLTGTPAASTPVGATFGVALQSAVYLKVTPPAGGGSAFNLGMTNLQYSAETVDTAVNPIYGYPPSPSVAAFMPTVPGVYQIQFFVANLNNQTVTGWTVLGLIAYEI